MYICMYIYIYIYIYRTPPAGGFPLLGTFGINMIIIIIIIIMIIMKKT